MDKGKNRKLRKRKICGRIIKTALWLVTVVLLFSGIFLDRERTLSGILLIASAIFAGVSAGISFWLDARTNKAEDSEDN